VASSCFTRLTAMHLSGLTLAYASVDRLREGFKAAVIGPALGKASGAAKAEDSAGQTLPVEYFSNRSG
jgi:hypothetical protein